MAENQEIGFEELDEASGGRIADEFKYLNGSGPDSNYQCPYCKRGIRRGEIRYHVSICTMNPNTGSFAGGGNSSGW